MYFRLVAAVVIVKGGSWGIVFLDLIGEVDHTHLKSCVRGWGQHVANNNNQNGAIYTNTNVSFSLVG